MESIIVEGITINAILDTRRPKRNGLFPVKYRVTCAKNRLYFNAGYDLTEVEWRKMNGRQPNPQLKQKRKTIIKELKRIENTVNDIIKTGDYSHEKLIRILKKGQSEFIEDAYKAKIYDLNKAGQVGTASIYNSAMESLKSYKPNTRFNDITPKWLEEYERHILKDITPSTLSIYLRTLRTLFNIAIYEGTLPGASYPFSRSRHDYKFKIQQGSGTKIALTIAQLGKFAKFEPPFKAMQRHKDLFLLSFHLGGINIKDMLLLTWDMIKNNELIYVREKTAKTTNREVKIRVPLTNDALTIIARWGQKGKGYILPFMVPDPSPEDIRRITLNIVRNMNRDLYKIGKALKIEGLSSYVARHTFATLSKNAGVPESFIKEVLGHTDIRTTQAYLKSFETQQRREQFSKAGEILQQEMNRKTEKA
jgi:integrase/recombinase XerD